MRLPPLIYNAIGKFFLFVFLTAFGIALVLNNGIVQRYRIMEAFHSFQSFFWEKRMLIRNYTRLRDINTSLIKQNTLLLKQNLAYKDYIVKTKGEENLASMSSRFGHEMGDTVLASTKYILAKVLKNSMQTQHNYLILDKGSADGITEDLGVITPTGAIGITRAVGKHYTYVLSFLNEKQTISARVGNSLKFGSLQWNSGSTNTATLREIPLSVEVKKGDIIYTSGYSSFYPPDIPIGTAVSFKTSSGSHKDITVELLQNFKNLDYVIVVKNYDKSEIDSLSNLKTIFY